MQILYITSMIAIFVLCLTLLSTVRRILGKSPLQSGELGLSRMYGMNPLHELHDTTEREEVDSPKTASYAAETVHEGGPFDATENIQSAPVPAMVMPTEPPSVTPISRESSAEVNQEPADQRVPAKRRKTWMQQNVRTDRSSTSNYNYLLEAFLIGISVVVLVQTQRSISRYRSMPGSSQDVA